MRYVLGPSVASLGLTTPLPEPVPPTPPAALADVDVTISSAGDAGCVLAIPAYDPTSHQAPVEYKVFLAPEGSAFPTDVHGWLGSAFPVSTVEQAADPSGGSVTVPMPSAPPGQYLLQVVLGYRV